MSTKELLGSSQEFRPFTDKERKALENDGAIIYFLQKQTIRAQIKAGRSFCGLVDEGDVGYLETPSIEAEVAIFPEQNRFFIEDSGEKDLETQELLVEMDSREPNKRLSLADGALSVIIPDQASTITELAFMHLDKTTAQGKPVWIFGNFYCRTKEPIDGIGDKLAVVGGGGPAGILIDYCLRDDGDSDVLVARLVVAKKK